MVERNSIVTEEELRGYLFDELIKRGHAPVMEVVEELTDIFLDYLGEKGCPETEEQKKTAKASYAVKGSTNRVMKNQYGVIVPQRNGEYTWEFIELKKIRIMS